jgi:hypothetical protein
MGAVLLCIMNIVYNILTPGKGAEWVRRQPPDKPFAPPLLQAAAFAPQTLAPHCVAVTPGTDRGARKNLKPNG